MNRTREKVRKLLKGMDDEDWAYMASACNAACIYSKEADWKMVDSMIDEILGYIPWEVVEKDESLDEAIEEKLRQCQKEERFAEALEEQLRQHKKAMHWIDQTLRRLIPGNRTTRQKKETQDA